MARCDYLLQSCEQRCVRLRNAVIIIREGAHHGALLPTLPAPDRMPRSSSSSLAEHIGSRESARDEDGVSVARTRSQRAPRVSTQPASWLNVSFTQ
eukprot:4028836-Amphidinium_carterae.1